MSLTLYFPSATIELDTPVIMGILNVTPDSFSDGGKFIDSSTAIKHTLSMIEDGAAIIDIGGESTRPGANDVSIDEECARVVPVIEVIRKVSDVPISIDTSKTEVMREAINAGASMINDVNALQAEGAVELVSDMNVSVCLMHMQGKPRTMQTNPQYDDVVSDVKSFLLERAKVCQDAGIRKEKIILDPGFGFGKNLEHNLSLFKHLNLFIDTDYPLLVGVSRKSMIGAILENRPVEERVIGSVALATLAAWMNAHILRVHDVKATMDAIKCCQAVAAAN